MINIAYRRYTINNTLRKKMLCSIMVRFNLDTIADFKYSCYYLSYMFICLFELVVLFKVYVPKQKTIFLKNRQIS